MKKVSTIDALKNGLMFTFKKSVPLPKSAFTNANVKKIFLSKIQESGCVNGSTFKLIEKLVDTDKIIPVECTDDYIKELNKKLKGDAAINPHEYDHTLGFYTGRQNRIYILMDHVDKLMGQDKKGLFYVTLHELQHMCCYNFPQQFISMWSNELYTFYGYFICYFYKALRSGFDAFKSIFTNDDKKIMDNLLDSSKGVEYFVKYLIYNHEILYNVAGAKVTTKDIFSLSMKLAAVAQDAGISNNVSLTIYKYYCEMIYDFLTGKLKNTYKKESNYLIIMAFRMAYIKTFGIDMWKYSFIYQESMFPSEVISMMSEFKYKTDSRYFKLLNNL